MTDAHDDRQTDHVSPPIGRRRWLSYSVRGLLVLVLLASLPAWWVRVQLDNFGAEHDAIARLRSLGAGVNTKPAEPRWLWDRFPGAATAATVTGGPIAGTASNAKGGRFQVDPAIYLERATGVDLLRDKGDDEQMKLVGELKHLTRLSVYSGKITDKGLAACAGLHNLVMLDLDECQSITGEGLRSLRRLKRLQELRLRSTRVDDRGTAFIERLPALKSLPVSDTKIGNAGLASIARIDGLEELDLTGTGVDDRGVGELTRLKRLGRLCLPAGVTSTGLARLSSLKGLRVMSITTHGPTPLAAFQSLGALDVLLSRLDEGAALAEVKRLPQLSRLTIKGGVSDATLLSLAGIKRPCYIEISGDPVIIGAESTGGQFTIGGMRALARSLPKGSRIYLNAPPFGREVVSQLQREFHEVRIEGSRYRSERLWPPPASHRRAGRVRFGKEFDERGGAEDVKLND